MKRDFDFYEFAAIILPGMIVLLFVAYIIPSTKGALLEGRVSVGEFGVLILLSYVCGHLVQAVSNVWEPSFWRVQHGMPTNWICLKNQKLLSESQVTKLAVSVKERISGTFPDKLEGLQISKWRGAPSQMYVAVRSEGRAGRIDTFNGNYGLLRGIVSAMLVIAMITLLVPVHPVRRILVVVGLIAALALFRMRRFAIHYAHELFVQFLHLPISKA